MLSYILGRLDSVYHSRVSKDYHNKVIANGVVLDEPKKLVNGTSCGMYYKNCDSNIYLLITSYSCAASISANSQEQQLV